MFSLPRALFAGALVASGLALAPAAWAQGGRPPTPVIVSQLYERVVDERLSLIGTVYPRRTSVVAGETEGVVRARLQEPGQSLERGQPLVRLESDELRAALIEAIAAVRLRRFRAEQSTELLARDAISEDQALEAEYEFARARARLEDLQVRIDNLTIRAPFRGALVESLAEIGEWIDRGQGVARVVATDTVRVYVNVPERHVDGLQHGALATVTVDALGTDSIRATIVAILDQGSADSHTFPVFVEFLNPEGRIRAGMSATVRFTVPQDRHRLLVHKDAVVTGSAGAHLFVVVDGIASMRPVSMGMAYQGAVAVRGEGLSVGDLAIVRGNERLREGQAVRVVRELQ